MEDLTGKQLGSYRIIGPLGEGGMAAVYKAYQPSMDRHIALKVLPRYYASDPSFVGRFQQEAKLIARLEHPNILPVYDYGESEGYTYLAMRYVEGEGLAGLLQGQPLPLPTIAHILSQLASALDYAHSKGVVHRDVKPSNVLIDEQGNCLLTDFGIARILEATGQFTSTGAFIGTPAYASPEQAVGRPLDGRSDIYSLGVVLYQMATGRPPFDAETPMAVLIKHIHDPLPMPRSVNPHLPEAVERIILRALDKEPDNRYSKAGDMAQALTQALAEETARPPQTARKAAELAPPTAIPTAEDAEARPERRRRIPAWGWIVAGLVSLCVVSGLIRSGLVLYAMTAGRTPAAESPTGLPLIAATRTAPPGMQTILPSTPEQPQFIEGPILSPAAPQASPIPAHAYGLPFNKPLDFAFDGSELWGLFDRQLVKLEAVESEKRFRAAQQQDFPMAVSVAWDESRQRYWTVPGTLAGGIGGDEHIDLIDRQGNITATYAIAETLDGFPRYVAWDGQNLWLTTSGGTLYRFQPVGGELALMDTYAQPIGRFPDQEASGLAWDGSHLWLLVDDVLIMMNPAAQPVCRIDPLQAESSQAYWWGWRGVTWDGRSLWVGHEEVSQVYRVDPAACK
jgi:hypothetical protein